MKLSQELNDLYLEAQKLDTTVTKEKIKQLSDKYDELYASAELILATHNPCKIKCGTCLAFRLGQHSNFCCKGCEHLKEKGCSVKALFCKIWVCEHVEKNEFAKNILPIYKQASELHLLVVRGSKIQSLRHALGL